MKDIEQMTSDERVRWVLTTPRSERPERGPLEALSVREMAKLAAKTSLSRELSDEVIHGFFTAEEAMEVQAGRNEAASEEGPTRRVIEGPPRARRVIKGPPRARRSHKLPAKEAQRPERGPLPKLGFWREVTLPGNLPKDLRQKIVDGFITLEEAKKEHLRAEVEAGPILHVVSGFGELKVWPGYIEYGDRFMKFGKFNTLPFARIERIDRRRGEFGLFSRHLHIVTTDGTDIELWSIDKENAELVTRTIYRAMGGDHTKVGKISLA